jgi:hypothetical protein
MQDKPHRRKRNFPGRVARVAMPRWREIGVVQKEAQAEKEETGREVVAGTLK